MKQDHDSKKRRSWAMAFAAMLALLGLGAGAGSSGLDLKDPVNTGKKASLAVLSLDPGEKILNLALGVDDASYPMACSRYGALILADATGDADLRKKVEKAYDPYFSGKRTPRQGHVDFNVFGIALFELYRQTGDVKYLDQAKILADDEFKRQRKDGLCDYTRFWVDDMYMVGSLQTQAYKSLKDPVYLERAYAQLLAYCDKLQQQNGLFYHTPGAPFFWGRGNGWAAASMTELLLASPEDFPQRPALMKSYRKMMAALIERQDPKGMWHQLIDDPESYVESSSSGMFIFALATGVRKGWLPKEPYLAAVEKAWPALAGYLDQDGKLREVCIGTGAMNSKTHYLERPRILGDLHGQAGFIWAATAVYLLDKGPAAKK